jgi:hypothetical protein
MRNVSKIENAFDKIKTDNSKFFFGLPLKLNSRKMLTNKI